MNKNHLFSFPDSVISLQKTGLFAAIDLHLASFVCRLVHEDDSLLALSVALLSRHTGQGNICLDVGRMDGALLRALEAQGIGVPEREAWKEHLLSFSVVGLPGEDQPLILDGNLLYMKRYFEYESRLAADLIRLAQGRVQGVDRNLLGQGLERYFPETGDDGFWQKVAAFAAVTGQLCVISGGPGTGKTTTVAKILALAIEQSSVPLRIALAAPTGKAAARLGDSLLGARTGLDLPEEVSERMPTQAVTLHRLLGWIAGSPTFRHTRENPLNVDLLIVDEVSMVDLPLMAKTVQALPAHARLILLGDRDQLASVEAGAVLGDICGRDRLEVFSSEFVTSYEKTVLAGMDEEAPCALPESGTGGLLQDVVVPLVKSYRFSDDSGIKKLSACVRNGNSKGALGVLAEHLSDISWVNTQQSDISPGTVLTSVIEQGVLPAFATQDITGRYNALQTFRILSPVREGSQGTVGLNTLVLDVLGAKRAMEPRAVWPNGLMLMVTMNDYGIRLYNGDVGLVGRDDEDQPRIFFPDQDKGGMRSIAPVRLPPYESAFAMTVHKSQGSEFDHVLFILPEKDSPVLTRELLYTAITRARKKVTLVCSPDMFARAVGRRISRSSGLGKRLHEHE